MLPRAFIMGAMRSGTSALARYVSAHPDLYLAPNKEVHFWDAFRDRGVTWYESVFDGMTSKQVACDATPFMYDHEAVEFAARTIPDARLVALIRNPVDRAYSHYWHNRRRDRENLNFEEAMLKEAERTAGDQPPRRRMDRPEDTRYQYLYWERSRYARHLAHAERAFSRDQILVVRNEDLRSDPHGTVASVLRHFELDPERWRREEKPERRAGVLGRLKRRVKGNQRSLDRSYPPLDPSVRAELLRLMEPEIVDLETWLGEPLPPSWRR